jgi:hypothetical protein
MCKVGDKIEARVILAVLLALSCCLDGRRTEESWRWLIQVGHKSSERISSFALSLIEFKLYELFRDPREGRSES